MAHPEKPWSQLGLAEDQAIYASPTQNVRAVSEHWAAASLFCPACGTASLDKARANARVLDFSCAACREEYELKATKGRIDRKLNDGALSAMTARLKARNNPSLFVMRYARDRTAVTDLIVVPKHFFTAEIIEPRKPLSATARRAGWQGCNILIGRVPQSGRIPLIAGGVHVAKGEVLDRWRSTAFLAETSLNARGWLLAVMRAVEAVGRPEFTLDEVYAHEAALSALYPENRNVRPKIRQQLQVLRDRGWLAFNGRGTYRRVG